MERIKKFQRLFFKAPNYKKSLKFILVSSVSFAILLRILGNFIFFDQIFMDIFIYSTVIFLLPTLLYSFVIKKIFKTFNRKRSFLLGAINMLLVFIGIMFSLGTDRFVVFILGVLYSVNLLSLTGIEGKKGIVPIISPLVYFALIFHLLDYFAIFNLSYIHFVSIVSLGIVLMLCIYLTEYFFHLNIPDMSAVGILSSFINNDIATIDCGTEIDTPLQKLHFKNNVDDFKMLIPWLHPGPIKGFGGGSMSTELIDKVNEEGKGFFWHFPSSHEDDPTDPSINDRIHNFETEYDYSAKATKILKESDGKYNFYGQKFENFYVFFIDGKHKDDYDSMIYREIKRCFDEKVVFVDTHNHAPFDENDDVLEYGEKEADLVRDNIFKLKDKLDTEELHSLKVGSYVSDNKDFIVIAEKVGNEDYLLVTLDSNGISKELTKELKEFRKELGFDKVIFFTTDAHDVANFIIKEKGISAEKIEHGMELAADNMEECEVGLMEGVLEDVKVLKDDWHMFHASLNHMLHFFPVAILVIYLAFFYLTFNLLV